MQNLGSRIPVPGQPPTVPQVVNPNIHAKQRIPARPLRLLGLRPRDLQKVSHLIRQVDQIRLPGRHKSLVDHSASISVVIGVDERLVELGGHEPDPVGSTSSGPAWVFGVADGVDVVGEGAFVVEPGLGVGVAAGVQWW